MLQIWFGVIGLAAGVTVMLSGVFASMGAEASNNDGIKITVVQAAPGK